MLLGVGVRNGSECLEPHLNMVLGVIHPLVCQPGIFDDADKMKNANELLRCFEIIVFGGLGAIHPELKGKS